MGQGDVTVGIVAYQATEQIRRCLTLLFRNRRFNFAGRLTVNVVDNSPPDHPTRRFLERAKALFDARNDGHFVMKFHPMDQNIGFGPGNNRIFATSDDPFVILLNPDVYTPPGWIGPMLSVVKEHGAAIVGTRILDTEMRVIHEGIMFRQDGEPYDGVIRPWPYGRPQAYECQAVTAACMLIQRPVYSTIAFDEEYSIGYYEDCDYCFEARKAGWQVWFSPVPEVIHERHSSWNERPKSEVVELCARNLRRFRTKWGTQFVPSDQWLWEKLGALGPDQTQMVHGDDTDRTIRELQKRIDDPGDEAEPPQQEPAGGNDT